METFLADSVSNLHRLLTWQPLATAALGIFFGLMWCFFGYRIFRTLLPATVALVGAVVGFSCAASVGHNVTAGIVGALMGGIVGWILGFVFVYVSVFLLGASFVGVAAWVLFTTVGKLPSDKAFWDALVVGLAGGFLALLLMRPLLIVYTALTGALSVVATVVDLIVAVPAIKDPTQFHQVYAHNLRPFLQNFWPIIAVCVLFLFGAGVIVQFSREAPGDTHADQEPEVKPARKARAA